MTGRESDRSLNVLTALATLVFLAWAAVPMLAELIGAYR
jgi:hypothetical protein